MVAVAANMMQDGIKSLTIASYSVLILLNKTKYFIKNLGLILHNLSYAI